LTQPHCTQDVKQEDLKNGESENFAFVSESKSYFRRMILVMHMEKRLSRRMEKSGKNVSGKMTLRNYMH